MIMLNVELQDWNDNSTEITVTIPSNIRSTLSQQSDYAIVDSTPYIPGIQAMDIWELNDILDEINCESPSMTAELLTMIMEAVDCELDDEEFLRRIKENDFLFRDLSEYPGVSGSNEEIAAHYIANELKIPFDKKVSKEFFEMLKYNEIADYINWEEIWNQYEAMGFKVIEDLEAEEYCIYLLHWR